MNFLKLIKDIWSGFSFEIRAITVSAAVLIIFLLIAVAGIQSCGDKRTEKKLQESKANVVREQTEANVLTNQKIEVEKDANTANADLGNVMRTDSNSRDGNFGTVKSKWCADHAGDSKCR